MSKRDSGAPAARWEAEDTLETEEASGDFGPATTATGVRPGFHLEAARKIEEARERLALRKAIEDFDDYDV